MHLYTIRFLLLLFYSLYSFQSVSQPLNSIKKPNGQNLSLADTGQINALNAKSLSLTLSDLDRSAKYREQAFKLSRSLGFLKGLAWNHYLKGVQYALQDHYLWAIAAESEAIKIAQKNSLYEIMGRAYNVIGLCQIRSNDDEQAKQAFQNALKAMNKSADKTYRAAIIHNIGSLYVKEKDFKRGFDYFNQSVALNIKSGNKQWLAQNYLEIGQTYGRLKNLKKAEAYGKKSLLLASQSGSGRCEIQALALLGSVHIQLKHAAVAKFYLDSGYKKVLLSGFEREKLTFYDEYANWYVLQGNYRKAYQFKDRFTVAHENFNKRYRSKMVLEFREKFENEQREAKYNQLENEQAISQGKILQKNYLLTFLGVLLAAMLVFTGFIFWGNKKVKISNRLLMLRNQEIEKQKADVEQLNHIKDKLFSVIAHDLRSPFANMKSMMDLYDEGMISKEEIDFFLKEIRKDMGSSTLLLDNLLIWAKSQLSGFKLDAEPVSLKRIVDEIAFFNQKKLISKGITLSNLLENADVAYADDEMIKAVIRNLIGNAIKFTGQNGSIRISAKHYDGLLELSVSDSGIGIKPEQNAQLFKSNFISTPGLNKEKGTGLGLLICKEFVEKNLGSIWLQSSDHKGSTFCFTLPESDIITIAQSPDLANSQELAKRSLREMIKNNMALQYRFDLYEIIAKVTNDIVYDVNLVEDEITWNKSLFTTFGYHLTKSNRNWWLQRVHSEDRDRIENSVNLALAERNSKWECEYRFRCEDGSFKFVFERGLILLDEENRKPVRMIGTLQDIQEQKTAVHQIERLSLVAKNVNNLVVITDEQDQVVWVNKAFEAHTGYLLEEIMGQKPKDFLSGIESNKTTLNKIGDNLQEKNAFSIELVNYNKAGMPYWVQIDCTPYLDPISNKVGYMAIQTVITERKRYEQLILEKNVAFREIARISSHDVRRPLSSIMGLVKLIESGLNQQELAECLHLLNLSAGELDSLIHDIHKHIVRIEKQVDLDPHQLNTAGNRIHQKTEII